MDSSHQRYQHDLTMATDLSLSTMNEQSDLGLYQQPLDLQASNQGNTGIQHGYVNNYNMPAIEQTSPPRNYMSSNINDQYHSNSLMSPYKSNYVSPTKVSYTMSGGNDQYSMNTVSIPVSAQDYSQKDLPNTTGPAYKTPTTMIVKPPKGYTGRGSEFSSGITTYRPTGNLSNNNLTVASVNVDSTPVKNPDPPPAMKTTPYKPRHNISEKVMRMEKDPPPQTSSSEDKLATQDYTETNLPRELMSKMFGLLKQGMFCDAVLVAGGKDIKVHKLVLMAASPFLMNKMANPSPGESIRVSLPAGIPLEVASQLIHYLYDGNVTITTENVGKFARIAKLFHLEHLLKICTQFVLHYKLDNSVLNVINEDISIMVSPISPQKTVTSTDNVKKTPSKKDDKNLSKPPSSGGKKPIKEANKTCPIPTTVNHVYGTRTQSGTVRKKTFKDESPTSISKKGSPANKKQATGVSKPETVSEDKLNVSPKQKSNIPTVVAQSSYLNHPRKRRLSMLAQEIAGNKDTDESMEDDLGGLSEEEMFEDTDSDYTPPSITTQSGMQRAVFEGARKGKGFKTLKKSSTLSSIKKGLSKKRAQANSPLLKSETTRQPPKKRAREFAEKEVEEMASYIFKNDTTTFTNVKPLPTNKSKKKKKQAKSKVTESSSKLTPYSGISRYASELEQMAKSVPENEKVFICSLCGNEFVFPKRCITHVMKTHEMSMVDSMGHIEIGKREAAPKSCDICGYVTKDTNHYYMHYHKYFRHGVPLPKGWKPYKCEICGKECFTKFQLKDHKLIHVEQTPFVCETCGTGFKSRTCLNSHVYHKHSTVRKHPCTECSKTFKTRTQLLVHKRTHSGEKPFQCPECSYKSTTRGNMRIHLTNRHKLTQDQIKYLMDSIKYNPSVLCIVEVNEEYEEPSTSEQKETKTKSSQSKASTKSQNVMLLNQKGEVDVIDAQTYNESLSNLTTVKLPAPAQSQIKANNLNTDLNPLHTTLSSLIESTTSVGTSSSAASGLQDPQQYLLQTINIPISQEVALNDVETAQLLLSHVGGDQLHHTDHPYTLETPINLVHENPQSLNSSEQVQKTYTTEEIQAMLSNTGRQFGQQSKTQNETFIQMVPAAHLEHVHLQDGSSQNNLNMGQSAQIISQEIPLQSMSPIKKQIQYQYQMNTEPTHSLMIDGQDHPASHSAQLTTNHPQPTVSLLPVSLQATYTPSSQYVTVARRNDSQQTASSSSGAVTVQTYIVRPQKQGTEATKGYSTVLQTQKKGNDDILPPTHTLWNTPITIQETAVTNAATTQRSQARHPQNNTVQATTGRFPASDNENYFTNFKSQ